MKTLRCQGKYLSESTNLSSDYDNIPTLHYSHAIDALSSRN
jgi:hypothetical protein